MMQIAGGFSVSTLIHDGRFSQVYTVEKNGQLFIMKQLHPRLENDPHAIEKFKKESRVPFIEQVTPRILDYIEYDGHHYILREHIQGNTIKSVLQNRAFRGKKYAAWRNNLVIQCCDKMTGIHEAGIIHGDVKPSNFIITADTLRPDTVPDIRVIDLGLAVSPGNATYEQSPVLYSMHYGAPEAVLNFPGLVNKTSDVYGLGMMAYEISTGRLPYTALHPAILLQLMIRYDLQKTPAIFPEILSVLKKATVHPEFTRPAGYYTAAEQEQLLKAAQTGRWQDTHSLKEAWQDALQAGKKRRFLFYRFFSTFN